MVCRRSQYYRCDAHTRTCVSMKWNTQHDLYFSRLSVCRHIVDICTYCVYMIRIIIIIVFYQCRNRIKSYKHITKSIVCIVYTQIHAFCLYSSAFFFVSLSPLFNAPMLALHRLHDIFFYGFTVCECIKRAIYLNIWCSGTEDILKSNYIHFCRSAETELLKIF